jgi:uncharacterized circularly permuted ATP-grasp superfamily protein/uncharacterized alpha-E superfamily protein
MKNRSPTSQPEQTQVAFPGAFQLGYPVPRDRWDEMVDGYGSIRPQWEDLVHLLGRLTPADMKRRWDTGLRLIRENGVTYNVYGDREGLDRPWQLDPLPLVITAEEWNFIEMALTQRAVLLNHILADLYGAQDLLAEGAIPPALVFGHPGFLRPLKNVQAAGGVYLHLYAADLARGADGSWQVVSDRCESPTGAGYALENRSIISRLLPDTMRDQQVRPLAPFFQSLRETMMSLSPRTRETPRIAVMTPGPYNEAFFEHAFLARFLGCTLVESEDLTMRDGRIWLKTLDGLQPIDIILRRTMGAYCDPLELRSDSVLGIAGLTQAVRAGTVVVANALGSGVLEGGTLGPFLPALARRFLGEDLSMPSVTTWWCGRPYDRDYVLANLDQLVVKSAFARSGRSTAQFGDKMSPARRAALATSIAKRPFDFIGQERIQLSTSPVWNGDSLDARPTMLRVFVACHDGSYTVMPGGLARVASERGGSLVSVQEGGGSKDVWVLADRCDLVSLPTRGQASRVKLVRGARDLPSRVADNLFWFGRYLERNEDTTRLLRAALSRAGSAAGFGAADELPLVLDLLRRAFPPPDGESCDGQAVAIVRMAFDPDQVDGPRHSVERAHRMASLTRDRLSADTWRAVNRLQSAAGAVVPESGLVIEEALNGLNNLILASESLNGLIMENMTRGLAWRFVDIGRRLERSVNIVDFISGLVADGNTPGGPALDVALEVSDSSMTYRSRYLSAPQFAPVLDLLLIDETNPRSLGFQLAALTDHVDRLAAERRTVMLGAEQRLMVWLTGAIRTADLEWLCRPDEDDEIRNLSGFLEMLRSKLWEFSEVVTRQYFTHAQTRVTAIVPPLELSP